MSKRNEWRDDQILRFVPHQCIEEIIADHRTQIVDLIAETYSAFYDGHAINPDTYSLRFPDRPDCRINALPAYVGRDTDMAGIKWVGSFPRNVQNNLQRASAVVILNSYETGYPVAIMDGKRISAARTAASAALAARQLGRANRAQSVTVFGAGIINQDILAFLSSVGCSFERIDVVDPDDQSRTSFEQACESYGASTRSVAAVDAGLSARFDLGVFGTSALSPWYDYPVLDHQTLLHVSLRDIFPDRLQGPRNIVDDVDHALKANTSLDLLRQRAGAVKWLENYSAIIAEPDRSQTPTVVSAFGMGILDVALAAFILDRAVSLEKTIEINDLVAPYSRWAS